MNDIRTTIQAASFWPTTDLAALAQALASPFEVEDYNQLNGVYQCEGNPNGEVYVNTTWPAVCFDVTSQVAYKKSDGKINNMGWV